MHRQDFRPDNIPLAVSRLRPDPRAPIVNQYFDSGQCRVFKADFSSGAIRVPLFVQGREGIASIIQGEADIPGTPLTWSKDFPTRPLRDKILRQVALIQEDLIEYTKEPRVTIAEHLERIINNRILRVRNGVLPEIIEQDCVD
ncbi:Uncharacterized protein TPAR_06285 [Tolypocladium paradoxum]|uniref:Uncharacterized protein n=1 Tax=Tolypocladium paradoxum TaxID=94208 RepID=A0A2S4KTI2_9HYPO|nr:Uncharacterized protein TPAR_06285 [Tolypocladium paradoxum]